MEISIPYLSSLEEKQRNFMRSHSLSISGLESVEIRDKAERKTERITSKHTCERKF